MPGVEPGAAMRRREFIKAISAGVATCPLAAQAQRAGPTRRIGILTLISRQDEGGRVSAFVAGLRKHGYVPGQNVNLDFRYADGDTDRLPTLARELIALAPDVVY